jgi:hypothetical protein
MCDWILWQEEIVKDPARRLGEIRLCSSRQVEVYNMQEAQTRLEFICYRSQEVPERTPVTDAHGNKGSLHFLRELPHSQHPLGRFDGDTKRSIMYYYYSCRTLMR